MHYFLQIQTPGGAAFQEGNVCTIVTYAPDDPEVGGGDIGYSSRKETPEGRFVNATGEKKGEYFKISCILGLNHEGPLEKN